MKHHFRAILAGGILGVAAFSHPTLAQDAAQTALPVTGVVLYSSGVGYFQREGEVDGKTSIDLRFKTEDINDLLKSMVLQDFNGGRVQAVNYDSQDPLNRRLRSFAVDLTANPNQSQLLNQLRGERAEVFWPNAVTGTILGVETRNKEVADNKVAPTDYLNLVTDQGLQSIPIPQIQRLRFLNERLSTELNQALAALASSHDSQKRVVGIQFDGQGKRKVRVAYIRQTPVWKTTYRLVLDEKDPPYLQGWAIVENTSDEDWNNVQLSLVSGRPISFVMDLYQPLYASRPLVQQELYSSLRPQTYGDALEMAPLAAPQVAGGGGFGGGGGGGRGGRGGGAGPAALAAQQSARMLTSDSQAETRLGREMLADKRGLMLGEGVEASAVGGVAGELFQYAIRTPVTLARQHSAMLPIVGDKIQGAKLSIYNERVQAKYPLNGFRLTNSTALHLLQGPITVFEDGSYAGDARIEDLAPGADRLLSYSLDLKTEVEPKTTASNPLIVSVKLKKGTMQITRKLHEERVYNIRNRDQKAKTVLIEHPLRSEWNLTEPKEATERTREYYRFAVKVDASGKAALTVKEEHPISESVDLTSLNSDAIVVYLRAQQLSAKVKAALQKAAEMLDQANTLANERARREQSTSEISQEQTRIRQNMERLSQNSDLYNRYVKKLNEQETQLEGIRLDIEKAHDAETAKRKEINAYLMGLDLE